MQWSKFSVITYLSAMAEMMRKNLKFNHDEEEMTGMHVSFLLKEMC